MLPIRNISYLLPMCCSFWEKCKSNPKTGLRCSTPLKRKVASQFLNVLAQFLTHYQHFCKKKKKKKKVMRHPKVRRGRETTLFFLCGLIRLKVYFKSSFSKQSRLNLQIFQAIRVKSMVSTWRLLIKPRFYPVISLITQSPALFPNI